MGLKGKLAMEIEIRSPGDVFHKLFASNPHNVPDIVPSHIQSCDLHEGEFGKNCSVLFWNYTVDGEPRVSKQMIENLDEEKKTVTFREIEGDMMSVYKTMLIHLHVISEHDNIDLVKWCIEYERVNEDIPHPVKELEFALSFSQIVEDHRIKA